MATLALAMDSRGALSGMRQFVDGAKQVKSAAGQMHDAGQKAFDVIGRAANIALGPLKAMVAATAAVKATILATAAASIKAAADYEMYEQQLRTVIATKKEADRAFRESIEFSVRTPFEPSEIIQVRTLLESVGVRGAKAVESVASAAAAMNREIRDIGSAVISLETEPLRRLGVQLQRDGEEFIFRFRDRMGEARSIAVKGFEQAQQALLSIFDSKFEGGLEKMSVTFKGLLSTLKGAVFDLRAEFGRGFLDEAKLVINDLIGGTNALRAYARSAGEAFGKEVERARATILATFDVASQIARQIAQAFEAGKGWDVMLVVFREGAGLVGSAIMSAFKASLALWKVIGRVLGDAIMEVLYDSGIPGLKAIGATKRAGDVSQMLSGMDTDQIKHMYGISAYDVRYNPDYSPATRQEMIDAIGKRWAGMGAEGIEDQMQRYSKEFGIKMELDTGYRIEETMKRAGETFAGEFDKLSGKTLDAVQAVANAAGKASGQTPVNVETAYGAAYATRTAEGENVMAQQRQLLTAENGVIAHDKGSDKSIIDPKAIRDANRDLAFQKDLLGKTIDERERAIEIERIQRSLEDAQRDRLTDEQEHAIDNILKMQQHYRKLQALADDMGAAFGQAFEDMVFGAKSAAEAARALGLEITRLMFRQMVTQPVANFFSGLLTSVIAGAAGGAVGGALTPQSGSLAQQAGIQPSGGYTFGSEFLRPNALGNAFLYGDVIPFALGGIISRPTTFPMNGGRAGLMGEAGPEAVMPLARGSDGRLGVRSERSSVRIVNVLDPRIAADYMKSAEGEQVVMNVIRRNRQVLKGAF